MRLRLALASTFFLILFALQAVTQTETHAPRLLLTTQRLKRLKRERERQTPRWNNFEQRVKTVPDSPERGFELSLYYAITGDEARGEEARQWAKAHSCDQRQLSLVMDLVGSVAASITNCGESRTGPISAMRNTLFAQVAANAPPQAANPAFLNALRITKLDDSAELYAAAEYATVLRNAAQIDIRPDAAVLFNSLPVQFLLNLKPAQVERPDWMTHITALALIGLDPNSDSSQFLQGWAIEDRQMLHDGPGVAYELLWADPYLPGVGYRNLDPWWYDVDNARLLARTNWSATACSVKISAAGNGAGHTSTNHVETSHVETDQCPAEWQSKEITFGKLQLIPMQDRCIEIAARPNNLSAILWKLPTYGRLKITEGGKATFVQADRAGMWRVPSNIVGKVCMAK